VYFVKYFVIFAVDPSLAEDGNHKVHQGIHKEPQRRRLDPRSPRRSAEYLLDTFVYFVKHFVIFADDPSLTEDGNREGHEENEEEPGQCVTRCSLREKRVRIRPRPALM
jgi:hypothetical protein